MGIFGPNGGGKTTLLKLILGFLKPSQGEIQVFGQSPKALRKKMGYVPQTLHFDRQFPISAGEVVLSGRLQYLTWYGHYGANDKMCAKNALEEVGLAHLYDRPFGTLSGGEKQRVLIARALVGQPKILLLDEPTTGIDLEAQIQLFDLLKQLHGKMTILMVTHELGTALNYVDTLFCVNQTVSPYDKQKLCEHFASGLYHPPLAFGEQT